MVRRSSLRSLSRVRAVVVVQAPHTTRPRDAPVGHEVVVVAHDVVLGGERLVRDVLESLAARVHHRRGRRGGRRRAHLRTEKSEGPDTLRSGGAPRNTSVASTGWVSGFFYVLTHTACVAGCPAWGDGVAHLASGSKRCSAAWHTPVWVSLWGYV